MSQGNNDLTGKRYGHLTVIEKADNYKNDSNQCYWKCLCDCGNTSYVTTGNLNAGRAKSCSNQCSKLFAEKEKMIGKRFGRLIVLEYAGTNDKHRNMWRCKCDCGNETIVAGSELKRKNRSGTESCGCKVKTINGMYKSRLYTIHHAMLTRCYDQKVSTYEWYGARGIEVCEEWRTRPDGFNNFVDWALSNGYDDSLTIDRIDNDGNYEPSNCRWVGLEIQANNTSRNHFLEFQGKKMTISQWARELDISLAALWGRIYKGWPIEKALSEPVKKQYARVRMTKK